MDGPASLLPLGGRDRDAAFTLLDILDLFARAEFEVDLFQNFRPLCEKHCLGKFRLTLLFSHGDLCASERLCIPVRDWQTPKA